ncbi:UPAR/Ly6 domain-containing protein bero-like [Haematobia irritans]|uniref:UPAR/Ly6 domain-containing protein bero-like n=1 Tax=Haematobia irritans TaxID=7368 RepID=UPI003F4FD7CA
MLPLKYTLAVFLLAALASSASAIHCYQCDSTQNSKCGEHFEDDQSMRVDCSRIPAPFFTNTLLGRSSNATGCMKKTFEKTPGETYVLRTCFYGDVLNPKVGCEMDPQNIFVKQLSCEVCSGNLCNGSSSKAPVAFAILAFIVMARLFS